MEVIRAQIQAIAMDISPVRRQLQHEGAELKGSLWSLRGNA
jgi:hypothetical protein